MKFDNKGLFSASGDYEARKPFDFQGEHFPHGKRFDWRRLGCSARKLRQLWDNGFIVPAGCLSEAPAVAADNSDPGDEASSEAGTELSKADAEARAKRVEAGKKSAEARKAKKAAAQVAADEPPTAPDA